MDACRKRDHLEPYWMSDINITTDADAVNFLFYHRRTIGYVINAMHVPEQHRDDIRQEVAFKIISRFRSKGVLSPKGNSGFAACVTRGACLDLFRRHKRYITTINEEQVMRLIEDSPLPDELLHGIQRTELLHRILAMLTPLKRHVVREVMSGKSMVEISKEMGRSHGSVKVLHHRAINEMKKILKQR